MPKPLKLSDFQRTKRVAIAERLETMAQMSNISFVNGAGYGALVQAILKDVEELEAKLARERETRRCQLIAFASMQRKIVVFNDPSFGSISVEIRRWESLRAKGINWRRNKEPRLWLSRL